ncbi:hypothetical protein Tco_1434954 [Tanacetum coccineum]
MHQPWRTFAAVINRCISRKTTGLEKLRLSRAQILLGIYHYKNVDFVKLLWEDFAFQIDNYFSKESMPYPRFTKIIINHFISQNKSISMRNRINLQTARDDSLLGTLKYVSKTEGPMQSSYVSSNFRKKLLNFENISLADNEIASLMDTTVRHENVSPAVNEIASLMIHMVKYSY